MGKKYKRLFPSNPQNKTIKNIKNLLFLIALLFFIVYALSSIPRGCVTASYSTADVLLDRDTEKELANSKSRFNQLQYIGTHNSEHRASLFSILVPEWKYSHLKLLDQLRCGIRYIELDIWFNRSTRNWEVWHECVDKLTFSKSRLLVHVLQEIWEWSSLNPEHVPLKINFDIKGAILRRSLRYLRGCGTIDLNNKDHSIFLALEDQILSVWPFERLCLPKHLFPNGSWTSDLSSGQWPEIREWKGCTMFELNLYSSRESCSHWYDVNPDRVMFKRCSDPNSGTGIYLETSSPMFASQLVQQNFLVSQCVFTQAGSRGQFGYEHALEFHLLKAAGVQGFRTDHPRLLCQMAHCSSVSLLVSPCKMGVICKAIRMNNVPKIN